MSTTGSAGPVGATYEDDAPGDLAPTDEAPGTSSGEADDEVAVGATSGGRWWSRTGVVVAGLTSVVAVLPLAVALGALRSSRWYPVLDLAQTELRVRDVGTSHSPTIGLAGRFDIDGPGPGGYEAWQGSHPGPLSFYALWPVYMLFGASAWALQVAAASLNIAAAGTSVWIAQRRGGVALALGVSTGLAVLMRAYGADKLTEAWNPYVPMLWWVVFLLAVWSVLCDDLPLLPVAVFAGSLCLQTHIPYLGMVGGVGGFTVLAVALLAWLAWRRRNAGPEPGGHPDMFQARRLVLWGGLSGALLAALWALPLVEQFRRSPGNMSVVAESLTTTEEARPSLGRAVSIWLGHLDLRGLLDPSFVGAEANDRVLPGLALVLLWGGAAAFSALGWRRSRKADPKMPSPASDPRLVRLHVVVGAASALGLLSISRITGPLYYYLVLWAWGTAMLLLVALGWTVVAAVRPRVALGQRGPNVALVGLGTVVLLATAGFTWDATSTTTPAARDAEMLDVVAPATIDELRQGELPGSGEDATYLLAWDWLRGSDELGLGGQAYGLFLELERQGFDVGAEAHHAAGVLPHRVLDETEATAALHYVVGPCIIERWRTTPEATLVTEHDLRTSAEIQRFSDLRAELVTELEAAGLDDLGGRVDRSLFGVAAAPEFPEDLEPLVTELINLGLPAAVFLTPPEVTSPTGSC